MGTKTATDKSEQPVTFEITKRDELMDLGFRVEGTDGQFNAVDVMNSLRRVPTEGTVIDLDTLLVRVKEDVAKNGPSDAARVDANEKIKDGDASVEFKGIDEVPAETEEPAVIDPDEQQSSIEDDIDTEEVTEVSEDAGGQGRLPGQERKICQPLTDAALDYHSKKLARVNASAAETAAKAQLKLVAAKEEYQKHFTPDPDNTDSKIYVAATLPNGKNIVLRDRKTWEETLTTEEVAVTEGGTGKGKKGKKK